MADMKTRTKNFEARCVKSSLQSIYVSSILKSSSSNTCEDTSNLSDMFLLGLLIFLGECACQRGFDETVQCRLFLVKISFITFFYFQLQIDFFISDILCCFLIDL